MNAFGFATPRIVLPANLPPLLAGTVLHHACLLIGNGTLDLGTNAEPLKLVQ